MLPATSTARRRARGRRPTACSSPTAPATRRPPTTRSTLLRGAARRAACRSSASASATRSSAGRSGFGTYKLKYGHRGINQPVQDRTTGKVEVTAHNHGFAVDAPRRRRRRRHAVRRRARSATSASTTTSSRGCAAATCAGVLGAVPPGGGGRAARRGVPLRPLRPSCMTDRKGAPDCRSATDIKQRPGHRLRADRHRAGLRVRLLRHPGLPGAAATRACGSSWSTPTRPRS